ncbi:MAG: hypothetical protein OEZ51_05430 [Nitrospinota bacterium]|nr:hypothetical protein [Nitrospinota bacterium]
MDISVLWLGLGIFAVICVIFLALVAVNKGLNFLSFDPQKSPLRSSWVPVQVYTGDDALDHPALKKLAEIQRINPAE